MTRYCSPVQELAYFLFNCTDNDLRSKHFDELLQVYHNSLKTLLRRLGGDIFEQFPMTALFRQLKAFGKYGILMSSFILPMISTKSEDLPDMDFVAASMKDGKETSTDGVEAMDLMFKNPQKVGSYEARMRGNIIDACNYGYL